MEREDQTRNLLIKSLRDVCKASVQLEKLDHERRSLEQVLESAWRSYRQLMEDASAALLLIDPQANIVASNKVSQLLLGYTAEELLATNFEDLCEEDGSSEFARSLQEVLEEGTVVINGVSALRKDGKGILVDTLCVAVTHEDKALVLIVLNEAKERQRVPFDEKRYVEKLEALSRATTALLSLPPTENVYKAVGDQVGRLVGNGYVLVSSFSKEADSFSVQTISGPEKHAEIILGLLLRHCIGVSFRLVQGEFQQYVTTYTPVSIPGGLPSLFQDKLPRDVYNTMQDFFLLGSTYAAGLNSGKDVFGMVTILMPKGARLEHVRLVATLIEQASLILKSLAQEFSESRGTLPETLVEDFQSILLEELPLPLEHKELFKHKGPDQPHLEETEKKTAEERLQQPAQEPVREPATEPTKEPDKGFEPEQDYRHLRHLLGHKKILVIDGEEIIRDVTGGLLSYMGCRVGFAKDGYDGLTQYKKALNLGEPYDAVILALALPGDLSPKETCQRLRQLDPGAKVVGSTGAAGEPLVKDVREAGFRAVIVRPYQGDRLANVLHKVLNDSEGLHKQRT
jgi:PAS domain S-box-containing protein